MHNGWVQQQLILAHPSVGCFVTHYGAGSLTEALMNMCQMVLLPQPRGDHVVNARVMGGNLKVGVEVERGEEDGLFKRKRLEYLDCVSQYYDIPDTERSDDEINMLRQVFSNYNIFLTG